MPTPNLQHWLYIELTTKNTTTGSTNTYNLSSRPVLDDTSVTYWPILQDVGNLGVSLGDYLPQPGTTNITLDNTPGSFGYERRISDIFERETPITQSIKLYAAETETSDLNPAGQWVLAWTATVTGIQSRGDTVVLGVSTVGIPVRNIGKVVTATEFPNAPDKSLGQVIPMILGSGVQVRPIQISPDGDTAPDYVYGVTMGTQFPLTSGNTYYAQVDQTYQRAVSAAAVNTPLYQNVPVAPSALPLSTGGVEWAQTLTTSATNELITQVRITMWGHVGTTAQARWVCRLWERDSTTGAPIRLAAESIVLGSSVTLFADGVFTDILFQFREPVHLTHAGGYMLGYYATRDVLARESVLTTTYWNYGSAVGVPNYNGFYLGTGDYRMFFYLYGVVFAETVSGSGTINNTSGYGHGIVELQQRTPPSYAPACDLTKVNFIVEASGTRDDSSGTCTGVASSLITRPLQAIKLLDQTWNGSSWVAGAFDFTKFSAYQVGINGSGVFPRTIQGKTSNLIQLSALLERICKNAGARITLSNGASKQLAVYGWDQTLPSVATITDEDCSILGYEFGGTQTVVNRVSMRYRPVLTTQSLDKISNGQSFTNYSRALELYSGLNENATALLSMSQAVYGIRPNAETDFEFVGDATTATVIAEYLCRTFLHPFEWVRFEVPYFKYRTVDLLDVVTIIHPALPSYFGTSSNASPATYQGSPVDLLKGDYMKRAKAYRAQIEGRTIIARSSNPPVIQFTARLLVNSVDPT